jgi:hypothetical protein
MAKHISDHYTKSEHGKHWYVIQFQYATRGYAYPKRTNLDLILTITKLSYIF